MKNKKAVFTVGLALFSMFFGGGDLVFPLVAGHESSGDVLMASCGVLITGVAVPFLGVFGMLLYDGNCTDFFRCLGKRGFFFFSFLTLAIMGPIGAVARCLTMMHAALQMLWPSLTLPVASSLICLLTYFLALRRNSILSVLGQVLTPFLLIALAIITFMGCRSEEGLPLQSHLSLEALRSGITYGYQTMNLLAAFFFSAFVIDLIKKMPSERTTSPVSLFAQASLVAAVTLAAVYVSLIMLGWIHSPSLVGVPPQSMLITIATKTIGSMGAACVALAICLACLTTVIVLVVLFADFVKEEVLRNRIEKRTAVAGTLMIGYCVSTYEFSRIAAFLGPILETLYPALIVLTVVNILRKLVKDGRLAAYKEHSEA